MFTFTLGRAVDFKYSTNRWLMIISLLVSIVGGLLSSSISQGIFSGAAFFFTWALTREIDPLHEYSAFVAGAFSLSIFFLYDGVNLGTLFFILLSLRLISGVCGFFPSALDLFSLFGLAGYLVYSRETSFYFILLFILLIMAWFRYSKKRLFLFSAMISLVFFIVSAIFFPAKIGELMEYGTYVYLLRTIIILVSIYLYLSLGKDLGITDDLGKELSNESFKKAQLFFSGAFILLIVFETLTISTYLILSSVLLGTTLYRMKNQFLPKR